MKKKPTKTKASPKRRLLKKLHDLQISKSDVVLACDPASDYGWALFDHGQSTIYYGAWDLSKYNQSKGNPVVVAHRKYLMWRTALGAKLLSLPASPTKIFYERADFISRGGGAFRQQAVCNALQALLGYSLQFWPGVDIQGVAPTTWKSRFVGREESDKAKEAAILRVKAVMNVETADHNIADALCILGYALSELNPDYSKIRFVHHQS